MTKKKRGGGKRGPGRPAATLTSTEKQREVFLENLRETLNVSKSARAAGCSRAVVYRWRGQWASFKARWEEAKQEGIDKLLDDYRDITEDTDTPARDRLGGIQFLLKVHAPERFSQERAVRAKVDAETGQAEIVIARAAPGVIDRLLDGSPLLEENGES